MKIINKTYIALFISLSGIIVSGDARASAVSLNDNTACKKLVELKFKNLEKLMQNYDQYSAKEKALQTEIQQKKGSYYCADQKVSLDAKNDLYRVGAQVKSLEAASKQMTPFFQKLEASLKNLGEDGCRAYLGYRPESMAQNIKNMTNGIQEGFCKKGTGIHKGVDSSCTSEDCQDRGLDL